MEQVAEQRTVWLLDVDGVLNASRPGWSAPPRIRNAYSGGFEYRIRWAPALLQRIRALHAGGRVDIRWCTTWCADAGQLEQMFELPVLPRAWPDRLLGEDAAAAKLAAARQVLAEGHRLIWTDDDEVPTDGPVRDELTGTGRALLIRPKPSLGLQPRDLDAIEAFITAAPA
ncbi:hypothetical protein NUM3379_06670 [Kineococcus sp. NUM-3379]